MRGKLYERGAAFEYSVAHRAHEVKFLFYRCSLYIALVVIVFVTNSEMLMQKLYVYIYIYVLYIEGGGIVYVYV